MTSILQPDRPIVVVDDDKNVAKAVVRILGINGYTHIIAETDSTRVIDLLREKNASLVLLDITMPRLGGDELLERIVALFPDLPVIMATANDSIDMVVNCMKKGAFDYITKPLEGGRLLASVHAALQLMELRRENAALRTMESKTGPTNSAFFDDILANTPEMLKLFSYIEQIAPSNQPVLISGETGVGKELAAQAVHKASRRAGRFVAVNVAGLDDDIFADTLFGHARGAFTGATSPRSGQLAKAAGGTLFLDEIGDLTLRSQVKLLRLLQEKEYFPLGSDTAKLSDARVIVATNRNFPEMLEQEVFRKDLYYRLNAHHVHLPPLRERLEDLHLLVPVFVGLAVKELGKKKMAVPSELYKLLANYSFPGNIRELKAMIYDAVSRQKGHVLGLDGFAMHMGLTKNREEKKSTNHMDNKVCFGSELPSMREIRCLLAEEALTRGHGNISVAARLIGLSRQSLSQFVRNNRLGTKTE